MSEPTASELLWERLRDAEAKADEVPVLKSEVKMLTATVDRLTNAVYQAAIGILVTGVLGVLAALILKGVIG
jgi:hypothetical protein